MFSRPRDLADDDVAAVVAERWGIDGAGIEHVPRGFGSHHWRIGSTWFVTVDEHAPPTLEPALRTARWLREEAGLELVVAPEPSFNGLIVESLADRWTVAVYPWVDGTAHDWGPYEDDAARAAVAAHLDRLHAVDPPPFAPVDDFALPPFPTGEWDDAGPYGEPAAKALVESAADLQEALVGYRRLVDAARREPLVLTHGEPHRANTIVTSDGVVLIDWESLRVAPAERDLWHLDQRPGLYRLRWLLTDVALYATDFQRPHATDEDTTTAWAAFTTSLESLHLLLPTMRRRWASH